MPAEYPRTFAGRYQLLGRLNESLHLARLGCSFLTGSFVCVHEVGLSEIRHVLTLARFSHPNVGDVFEVGESPPYVVTPYYDGLAFAQLPVLELGFVTGLAVQACAGVQALHEAAIVCGTLTDRHAFVTTTGDVKLLPVPHEPADTWRFAAPEAFDQRALDPRVDVYSLAAIVSRLLGDRELAPVTRGLAHDPEARFETAAAFGAALAKAASPWSPAQIAAELERSCAAALDAQRARCSDRSVADTPV